MQQADMIKFTMCKEFVQIDKSDKQLTEKSAKKLKR